MSHTLVTAPTRFVEANGFVRLPAIWNGNRRAIGFHAALPRRSRSLGSGHYRRARQRSARDPVRQRRRGSSGDTPETIQAMGDDAIAFVGALGLAQIDLLGFSIGGYVAQAFTLQEPNLVRRLMLLGTGPRGRERSQDANFLKYTTSTDPGDRRAWRSMPSCTCSSRLRRKARRPAEHFGNVVINAKAMSTSQVPCRR